MEHSAVVFQDWLASLKSSLTFGPPRPRRRRRAAGIATAAEVLQPRVLLTGVTAVSDGFNPVVGGSFSGDVLANDIIDIPQQSSDEFFLTTQIVTGPQDAGGYFTFDPGGSFGYGPPVDWDGSDQFTYKVILENLNTGEQWES